MRTFRRVAAILIALLAITAFAAPRIAESRLNRVLRQPPYKVSQPAQELHRQLIVADLHADSLLFGRNLLDRSSRGHVDVPRLRDGNVAIQAFTVVTKVPRHLNIERNSGDTDDIRTLAMVEMWPPRTWNSLIERALYKAEQLNRFAERSKEDLVVLRSRPDLANFLECRRSNPKLVAGFLGLEGAQALEGKLSNLDRLYEAGYRMVAPTHFYDTEMSGAAAGIHKGGLTPLGREWVHSMEAKQMIIDLAHASPKTIQDVTSIATRPVIVSHTGVKGTCNNNRNLSDGELRAVAKTGGLIGIGFWETATCGRDAAAIARAISYAANLIGIDHVALGSDFDGAVTQPFDATGMPLITEALMKQGFSPEEIAKIMGGNVVRFLQHNLPER
jgi:microsomal dipeptidase-like Zn-dependent dipeptidase